MSKKPGTVIKSQTDKCYDSIYKLRMEPTDEHYYQCVKDINDLVRQFLRITADIKDQFYKDSDSRILDMEKYKNGTDTGSTGSR